jgi:hypothetical protein
MSKIFATVSVAAARQHQGGRRQLSQTHPGLAKNARDDAGI